MFATQNAFNEKHERAAHDALMSLCGTNKCNQGISIQIFVKFPTRVMANKNEEHVVHSSIYVRQKKEQRGQSFIPKSMCDMGFFYGQNIEHGCINGLFNYVIVMRYNISLKIK